MRVLDLPGRLWSLGRKVEELLALQRTTREALEAVETRLRTVEDRLLVLESGQQQLVVEARAAAGAASTAITGAVISDIVSRVTRVEMRTESITKLLPPGDGSGNSGAA